MQRSPSHRGGIVSAGYDRETRCLDIEFDTKRVLRYENVGSQVADRFLNSAEPVAYYQDVIREEYSAVELSRTALKEVVKKPAKKGISAELKALFGE